MNLQVKDDPVITELFNQINQLHEYRERVMTSKEHLLPQEEWEVKLQYWRQNRKEEFLDKFYYRGILCGILIIVVLIILYLRSC